MLGSSIYRILKAQHFALGDYISDFQPDLSFIKPVGL